MSLEYITRQLTMKSNSKFIVKVFLVFLLTTTCRCQEVGQSCTIKATDEPGVCTLSYNCPDAEEQAKKGISPTLCGFFQLTTPIVCCESKSLPQPNDNSFNHEEEFVFPDISPVVHTNSGVSNKRKSEQKCLEYSKFVTGVVQVIPLVTNTEPININVPKCFENSSPLIVGGAPAQKGEFPYMALIGYINDDGGVDWRCGGTLISDRWVVSAAHCTYSRDNGEPKIIRLGELDYSRTDDSEHKDYNIARIEAHPNYLDNQKYDDIALFQTATVIQFTRHVRPACLYVKSNIEQTAAIATGWGRTDFSGENTNKLMKVSLNIYPLDQCKRVFKNEKSQLPRGLIQSMLCAGELKGGKDTCSGDSGGPLVITDKQNYCKFYIIGITSFGKLCGEVNTPAVYTRISEYVDWIEKIVW